MSRCREELPAQFQPTHRLIPVDSDAKMRGLLWLNLQPNTTVAIANKQDYYLFNICQKLSENWCPIHTADATKLLSFVASVYVWGSRWKAVYNQKINKAVQHWRCLFQTLRDIQSHSKYLSNLPDNLSTASRFRFTSFLHQYNAYSEKYAFYWWRKVVRRNKCVARVPVVPYHPESLGNY